MIHSVRFVHTAGTRRAPGSPALWRSGSLRIFRGPLTAASQTMRAALQPAHLPRAPDKYRPQSFYKIIHVLRYHKTPFVARESRVKFKPQRAKKRSDRFANSSPVKAIFWLKKARAGRGKLRASRIRPATLPVFLFFPLIPSGRNIRRGLHIPRFSKIPDADAAPSRFRPAARPTCRAGRPAQRNRPFSRTARLNRTDAW